MQNLNFFFIFALTWDNPSAGNCVLQIINNLGVTVFKDEMNLDNGFKSFNLSGLNDGVYFMTITYKNNVQNIGKLILIK